MSTFFISPSKPPNLDESMEYRIDPAEYAARMRQRWPDSKLLEVKSGGYILHWELNQGGRLGLSGGLQSNRLVVSFGSSPRTDAIDFAHWHRGFVPAGIILYLFDANLELVVELTPGMDMQSLASSI